MSVCALGDFCVQGITYDHIEMNFFLNGTALCTPFMGIKGTVFPAFYGMEHTSGDTCVLLVTAGNGCGFLSLSVSRNAGNDMVCVCLALLEFRF